MKKTLLSAVLMISLFLGVTAAVEASHIWGTKKGAYHWDTATLSIGDNLTTQAWQDSLGLAVSEWDESVLDVTASLGSSNEACDPVLGNIEACNGEYGDNGWLGIAQIWIYNGKDNHIAQGLVKLNDTYYNTPKYDTTPWRNLVMCQEVAHTFGLGHQDETFDNTNLGSCMDYTNDPDGTIKGQLDNQYPNQHDYDMLAEIYGHVINPDNGGNDGGGPGKGNGNGGGKGKPADIAQNDHAEFGQAVSFNAHGKADLFRKDLGNGQTVFTHVFWIPGEGHDHHHE